MTPSRASFDPQVLADIRGVSGGGLLRPCNARSCVLQTRRTSAIKAPGIGPARHVRQSCASHTTICGRSKTFTEGIGLRLRSERPLQPKGRAAQSDKRLI